MNSTNYYKCIIDYSLFYMCVEIQCNDKTTFNNICLYFKSCLIDKANPCPFIKIDCHQDYSLIESSFMDSFETCRGNELESVLKMLEKQIFEQGGFNNDSLLPIHGSSFAFHNNGYIIIGNTNAGKSTLLLYLLLRKFLLVSDDITLIRKDELSILPFSRPLHVRDNTLKLMKNNGFILKDLVYPLSSDSSYIPYDSRIISPKIQLKAFILVEYNKHENGINKVDGYRKILHIVNNIKYTQIDGWHKYIDLFKDIAFYHFKYKDFQYVDDNISTVVNGGVL